MTSSGFDGLPRACLQHLAGLQLAHLSLLRTSRRVIPRLITVRIQGMPASFGRLLYYVFMPDLTARSVSCQSRLPDVAGAVDAQCS